MIQKTYRLWVASLLTLCSASAVAQQKVEILPFGNMDQWVTREIKESGIIGGNTKKVYAIGPTETIVGAKPYANKGGSPWGTSNVMARVSGITKNQYFGISRNQRRRFLCPSGYSYGECKSTWYCRYHRTCCRIYVFGNGS